MYTGSGISKETQHISPHIAAHKSSLAPTSSVSSITSTGFNSGGPYDLVNHHINKSGFNTHIPTYKAGMHQHHQSIAKGLEHDGATSLGRHGHTAMSHHSKSIPQDLSAHGGTDKAMPLELTPHSSIHHKPLPHIHTVVSQGVSGNQIGSLIPAHQTDRSSYFRMPDSVLSMQGPSAVLVSSHGEGVSSSSHSHASSMVHAVSSHNSASNLTTMPAASLATTVPLPGGVASTMSNSHMMPSDCSAAHNVSSGCVMPHSDLRGVKKEKAEQLEGMGSAAGQRQVCHPDGGPQRDLVRQALQAVVTNPQHKTELLMMNIQVNASLQAMNKGTVPPEQEAHEGGEVVMLQPAEVDETNSLASFSQSPKRRRPKLSDEAQAERRLRIALRMREKRATESDEQKRLRRIREAERMRRKRATENEEQKERRRLEAASRARNRRATMTMQERVLDRQRAAERMRMRRATESPDTKTVRRLRAAERMRKRRATETPEQRNQRRQRIAVRMKARRKRKGEENINGDEAEVSRTVNTRLVKTENSRSGTQQESSEPVVNANPNHSTPQTVTSSPHIYVPSTIGVGGGGIAVLHMDSSLPSMSLGHAANPGLSTVDMTQLGQPLSLQKSSSANHEQKQAVVTQHTPTSVSSQETSSLSSLFTSPHSTLPALSLHKASSYHHHIPHLLHYHQPHSSSVQQHSHQHHHLHHHHNQNHSSHHHLQQRHQHQ